MPRPEVQAPPEIFYGETEARKYTTSSRIIEIQVIFCFLAYYLFVRSGTRDFSSGYFVPVAWGIYFVNTALLISFIF